MNKIVPYRPPTQSQRPSHVRISTSHELAMLYRDNDFARFCETHGFPTGAAVPTGAADLIEAAFHAAGGFVRIDRNARARALVAEALAAVVPIPHAIAAE